MSKTSYFFIAVIVTALLFMSAVRGYQFYAKRVAEQQEEYDNRTQPFSFQNVPLRLAPPEPEPVSRPVLFTPKKGDVFFEEAPLSTEDQTQQSKDTIESILADYKDDPNLRAFNQELKKITQGNAVDLMSLSGGDLGKILHQNPQISEVVSKHMQNPDFAKTIQQIFSNPQFIQSVQQLQQTQAPVGTKKADK